MADLPGAVHLIAEAPMLHFVRLSSAILSPEFAPTRAFVHVAVFNELSRLLRGAGTEIHGEERLRGGQAAPREKFIRAKLIGINRVPGFVENGGSISSGADAIQPVIRSEERRVGKEGRNRASPHANKIREQERYV